MKESEFQKKLIRRIKDILPSCIILKNDPGYKQGIPDLLILNSDKWAMLEVKRSKDAKHQPNQDYYVEKLNVMSYSAFIFPENEEEIINDLREFFLER